MLCTSTVSIIVTLILCPLLSTMGQFLIPALGIITGTVCGADAVFYSALSADFKPGITSLTSRIAPVPQCPLEAFPPRLLRFSSLFFRVPRATRNLKPG